MATVLELASAARARTTYTTFASLDGFAEYHDGSDDTTRVLATRESDGAVHVLFCSGAHAALVVTLNERNRIGAAERDARKVAADIVAENADASADEGDENYMVEYAEAIDHADAFAAELAALAKVKAQPTMHVARALEHYSRMAAE